MNKKISDESKPVGNVTRVDDFLPPPSQLITKDDQKITINLSKGTVDFFKHEAKVNNVPYQRMVRTVLDEYARHYDSHLHPGH